MMVLKIFKLCCLNVHMICTLFILIPNKFIITPLTIVNASILNDIVKK